jgi:hypothetical protein
MRGMNHIVEPPVMISDGVATVDVRVILRSVVFIVVVVGASPLRVYTLLVAPSTRPAIVATSSVFVFPNLFLEELIYPSRNGS